MQQPYRIELPTPFAVGSVNAYLFTKPEPVLVDCGIKSDENWQALETGLAEHGLTIADIKQVVITHAHVDHAGSAKMIADVSGAQVWVSDVAYPWVKDLSVLWPQRVQFMADVLDKSSIPAPMVEGILDYFRHVQAIWDEVPEEYLVRFPIDGTLEMGGMTWQVVYAPGHANTQTCFYQPETKQFLAADMLLHRTPVPVIEPPLEGNERVPGLPQFLEMLDKLEGMDIGRVYPGHGEIMDNYREVIANQRARISKRKQQCLELIQGETHTLFDLMNIMYSHYPVQARLSGLGMLVGYLDLLLAEGAVERRLEEGWRFYATG